MIDLDRASLDRVLPAATGEADWDDVVSRSRAGQRRHRRRLVALAAAALVVAVGTASAFGTVRDFFLDRGFVGLPPREATPSAPKSGTLVLSFSGRSMTLGLRMTHVFVYADGRLVWIREGGAPTGANELTSGFLEQRLTREGVERLRSEAISTGLFSGDIALVTERAFRGSIRVRNDERLVRVDWMRRDHLRDVLSDFPGTYAGTTATPEQERILERLDALLADPGASLPASAWQERTVRAYVASRYAVCWGHHPELGLGTSRGQAIPPARVLTMLPAAVEQELRRRGVAPRHGADPPKACSVVPTERARAIGKALAAAGLEQRGGGEGRGSWGEFGLSYRFDAPDPSPGRIYIFFEPTLPHGEWICTACG